LASPEVPSSPELSQHRREAGSQVTSILSDAGVNMAALQDVQAGFRRKLEDALETERRAAVERSALARDRVQAAMLGRRDAIDQGSTNVSPDVAIEKLPVLLDKPFLIAPRPAIVSGEQIAPFDSWAKTTFTSDQSGNEEIRFYFSWQNPGQSTLTVEVSSALGFYGRCFVRSETNYSGSYARLHIYNVLIVNRIQRSGYVAVDLKDLVTLYASATGWVDDSDGRNLVRTQDLSSTAWAAPVRIEPGELVVFEVGSFFHHTVEGDGSVSVNFDDGFFAISCPFVAIKVVSS
jgi:hypothetical protein